MSLSQNTLIQRFWDFVSTHEERLCQIRGQDDPFYEQLMHRICLISKDVVLEISHNDDRMVFVFSCQGKLQFADTVRAVVSSAPKLSLIAIQMFRPKINGLDGFFIESENNSKISIEDVSFVSDFYDGLYDLELFVPEFDAEDPVMVYTTLLALNLLIGEKTVLSLIGSIDIKPQSSSSVATKLSYLPYLITPDNTVSSLVQ